MSENTHFAKPREFDGPFSKVAFECRYHSDSKQDAMTVVLYDEDGTEKDQITIGTRVSPTDGAVLMSACTAKGERF